MPYSPGMSVLEDVYDGMCEFDDLLISYRNARKGKRYKRQVLAFTDNLESEIISIRNDLKDESYKMGPYHLFYVHEPKTRLVMSIQFRDRVMQWSIYRRLNPFYDKIFIEDSYACRKGKGSHMAADKLQYWLRQVSRREIENPEVKYYYLKIDVSKYFYRISHEILIRILSVRIHDERLLNLLVKIINSDTQKFGLPMGCSPDGCDYDDWLYDVGMPIGNITSQVFANVYLNELDQFCKHALGIHFYIRYMDDVIILSDSKEQLNIWKEEISKFLSEALELQLNKKTAIRPVTLGVEFVGYKMFPEYRKLKKSTSKRIIKKFKVLCYQLAQGEITREELDRHVASYNGMLEHCSSHGLRNKLNRIYIHFCVNKQPWPFTEPQPTKQKRGKSVDKP